MAAYYNENDPKAAAWLRELIKQGYIAPGDVDSRSIEDVRPSELAGYAQCHFFAGIGGWSYALRLAGWPDDRAVWTGSCPCQCISSAARGNNTAIDRWPDWRPLIVSRRPLTIFGEQVASEPSWFDEVCNDLETVGYAVGAAVLPAVSIGADHIRNRIYFVGDSHGGSQSRRVEHAKAPGVSGSASYTGGMVPTDGIPARVAYRGFGNAIVPQVAAEFIGAYIDTANIDLIQ
jgi:DNA (cytosine-5)-methyltransferase 1